MNKETEISIWAVALTFNAGFATGSVFNLEYNPLINFIAVIGCVYRIYYLTRESNDND